MEELEYALVIHHGGQLVQEPQTQYIGGEIDVWGVGDV